MTVKFEEQENNKALITFEIAREDIEKGLDKTFKRVKKNLNVPGFRKGKVPRQVFNSVYGEEALYNDTIQDILPGAYDKALKESGRANDIFGEPEIDIKTIEKKSPWVFEAIVHLKPEVTLGEYKGLSVEKQDTDVTDEEVNEKIEQLRQDLASLVIKDGAAEDGDTVVIDYTGSIDGEAFDGGTDENHSLKLGSNSFIPGFEDQLIGAEPGSEIDVTVTFPEDYHAEHLAGKEAIFKTKVHEVKALELPELDDEFAQDADDEVESLDELINKTRVQLEESKAQQAADAEDDEALRKAVENAEIEGGIPEKMVNDEIDRQVDYQLNNFQRQGINPELYFQITGTTREEMREQFAEDAELRTKTNLVLEAISKAENIEVSDSDIEQEVESLASVYGLPAEQVRQYVTEEMLANDVKLKKAMDIITDTKVY